MTITQVLRWIASNLDILVVLLAFGGPVVAGLLNHLRGQAQKRRDAVRREREALEELRTGRRVDSSPSAAATFGGSGEGEDEAETAARPQTTLVRLPGGVVIEMPLPPEAAPVPKRAPSARTSPTRGVPGGPGSVSTPPQQPVGSRAPIARPLPQQPSGTAAPSGISQGGMIAQAQRREASGKREAKQDKVDQVVRGQVRQAQREDDAKRRSDVAARDRARLERDAEDKAAMALAFANPTERATDAQSKRATQAGSPLNVARGSGMTGVAATAGGMSPAELRRAIIMQELLSSPVSMREAQGAWKPPI
jgi:hypothetical protein